MAQHRLRGSPLRLALALGLAAAPAAAVALPAEEEPRCTPVQIALVEDLALPPAERVCGLRLVVLSATAEAVTGLDLLGLASRTRGDERGLQLALYETVGSLRGAQVALLAAEADGPVGGLQLSGLFNHARELLGAQIALFVNHAGLARGLQLGLVNWASDVDGVQLGLLNVERESRIPVLPLLRIGW